jgi:hypothetical protein
MYDKLMEFHAYAHEADHGSSGSYSEEAALRAFSSFADFWESWKGLGDLLEKFPSETDSLRDLMIKTRMHEDRIVIFDMYPDIEEPDKEQKAAIHAVKHNYSKLTESDMLL